MIDVEFFTDDNGKAHTYHWIEYELSLKAQDKAYTRIFRLES